MSQFATFLWLEEKGVFDKLEGGGLSFSAPRVDLVFE